MSKRPLLVLVGGFLGAGKTTLILKAAQILQRRGERVAIVTNDQDAGLVDTEYARARGLPTDEVAGGCFCCRFSDFVAASEALRVHEPDVIFAEPVGSCVDLSATILQPLKALYGSEYRLAPLTVLIDPATARQVAAREANGDVQYLVEKQLAEADLICVTKQDLYPDPEPFSFPVDFTVSAATGAGVERWLAEVMTTTRVVGAKLLDIDYQRYAEAEAALGWLNLHASLEMKEPVTPAMVCGPLLERLQQTLSNAGIRIAHLKMFDRSATGWIKAGVVANGDEAWPEGDLLAEPTREHQLAVNLRAIGDPKQLKSILDQAISELGGTVTVNHASAFRPAPPKPEHRFSTSL